MTGHLTLIHGDALRLPLADQSVHLVVTSPPYFALRSYRDGDEHYDGQLGSEETPHHFLAALWAVLDECWRVLRDDGSAWINLGDKFAGSGGHNNSGLGVGNLGDDRMRSSTLSGGKRNAIEAHKGGDRAREVKATRRQSLDRYNQNTGDLRPKSRMLLPHRFALGLIDPDYRAFTEHRAGLTPTATPPQWICRMDAVWSKLNSLPESVTDRVRASHEYWLHFTKSERYFAAMDEIREEHRWKREINPEWSAARKEWGENTQGKLNKNDGFGSLHPLGKLPSSVWKDDEEADTEWIGKFGLCPRCGELKVAGNGQPDGLQPVTVSSGLTGAVTSPTDSATNSSVAPSLLDFSSTTSAETAVASTLNTSNPSPSERTSSEATLSPRPTSVRPTAATGTPTTPRTPIGLLMEVACAGCACERVTAASTGSAEPSDGWVWSVATEPLSIPDTLPQHFAAFPSEFPRRIVLGWSPSGVCAACGEPRRPICEKATGLQLDGRNRPAIDTAVSWSESACADNGWGGDRSFSRGVGVIITGYACACPAPDAPIRPAVVLDPFSGTGTAPIVAAALGRHGIGVDLSWDYHRIARWRARDGGLRAKALSVDRPERQLDGQASLFDGLT